MLFRSQLSIDEAFLDVTARCSGKGECGRQQAIALAHEMRKQIYDNLGFTVNVGIAQNKLLAKMASDFTKPDRVHTLFPEELNEKFLPLPIEELYGCGPSTAKRLRTLGLCTIGEVAECSLEILQSHLGKKAGQYIYESTHGIGSDVVQTEKRKAKSVNLFLRNTKQKFPLITPMSAEKRIPTTAKKRRPKVYFFLRAAGFKFSAGGNYGFCCTSRTRRTDRPK